MKINCKSCSQPIEIDDGADLTGAQCPSCGASLLTPRSAMPAPPISKTCSSSASQLALLLASVSLALAIYCTYSLQKNKSGSEFQIASADPSTTIRNYYRISHSRDYWTADGAFWRIHAEEIAKSFEIVSTNTQDNYILGLVRYSVADKVFRDSIWIKKVDGMWYFAGYVSTYDPNPEVKLHLDWFKSAEEKKEAWEKESANP